MLPGLPGPNPLQRNMDEVRAVVESTRGYFVRDWSLWLGWNNMKYIIEMSLHQAMLLNRTLVLPSFVYARDCEFSHEVCSSYAPLVNRRVSGSEEWLKLPEEDQQGWRIPISTMFLLPPSTRAITLSQFLLLHGLSPLLERPDGQFDASLYLSPSSPASPHGALSLAYIPNAEYDPPSSIRLDRLPAAATEQERRERNMSLQRELDALRPSTHLLPWSRVRDLVHSALPLPGPSPSDPDPDQLLVGTLRAYGLAPVYQFRARAIDLAKSVFQPERAFVRVLTEADGWVDDFGDVGEEVLWLMGEVHNRRKPGSMYFHSPQARDAYARIVLQDMRFPREVEVVAERLAQRMREKVHGRMWMAAHMRRGDFVTIPWTHTPDFEMHVRRVKQTLERGRTLLQKLALEQWADFRLPDAPDVVPYKDWLGADAPLQRDVFYVATDERNPAHLAHLRAAGAVLLSDLITPQDRQLLGAPAVLTDYVSLLEQALQIRAAFWTGYAVTSVSGTVANGRAARGCDVRTTVMDS
ncbi:hypothetical protein CALVIDRAFT_487371 [Calocera viscosa TUFC12733]|uniref:Uncharacterized protein n=1 Tax=Calocera viscosa (strain TUFC12733) TaxID=1330018 RepID=A0A167IDL4_CALVF|nr:hypothetical protein CALVIDRAFT_487371 [Calocera viscosa TUFC12733]